MATTQATIISHLFLVSFICSLAGCRHKLLNCIHTVCLPCWGSAPWCLLFVEQRACSLPSHLPLAPCPGSAHSPYPGLLSLSSCPLPPLIPLVFLVSPSLQGHLI